MAIQLQEPELIGQIEQIAEMEGKAAREILTAAVRSYLDEVEREKIHAETEAFWAMHDELVATYGGEYVALHRGEVVDHDTDVSRLEQRVRQRFGPIAIMIAPVTPEPRRDLQFISFRLEGMEPQR